MRLRSELEVTGTFKHRKMELKNQGYDINKIQDPVFYLSADGAEYLPLNKEILGNLEAGNLRL